jgi:hypothetical protein
VVPQKLNPQGFKGDFTMTAQIHEDRRDKRLYYVTRNGRIVKRFWHQMDDKERAGQIEAELRAAYVLAFDIY